MKWQLHWTVEFKDSITMYVVMYIWEIFGSAYWRPRREDWWWEVTMPGLEWWRREEVREKSFWSREVRRGGWTEAVHRTWSRRKASAWEPVKLQVSHRVFIISFFKWCLFPVPPQGWLMFCIQTHEQCWLQTVWSSFLMMLSVLTLTFGKQIA